MKTTNVSLASTAVLVLCYALFIAPVVEGLFDINSRYVAVAVFLGLSLMQLFMNAGVTLLRWEIVLAFIVVTTFILSLFLWPMLSTPGSYLSPLLVTLLVALNRQDLFERALLFFLMLSLSVSFYEFFAKSYLYVVSATVGGIATSLDEKLFSGGLNLFRAKGLFEGPLTQAQYSVYMALLFFRSRLVLAIALSCAVLTASRMAILVVGVMVFIHILFAAFPNGLGKIRVRSAIYGSIAIVLAAVMLPYAVVIFGQDFITRFSDGLTFSGDSNALRAYYWVSSLEHFSNYSLLHQIFGANGTFLEAYENNAESGWLTLLVDNGLIGLVIYLGPVVWLGYVGLKRNKITYSLFAFVIILVNASMTFYLSASGNVLYWYLLYKWFREIKKEHLSPYANYSFK